MAKRKSKSKPKPKRRAVMATKKRKKRRSSVRRTISRTTLAAAPRRRRRKKGLFDGGSNLMASLKHNGAGAVGGAAYLGLKLIAMPMWLRVALGFSGSVASSMMGAPFLGAGMAGAAAYEMGSTLVPAGLLHDDLEDADWVDADTLNDSGYMDDEGNPILQDENGIMYALNDGELVAVGDAYQLNDGAGISSYENLEDPYSLQSVGY